MAEPEISAVIAAAPVPAWRILRSVCWMLGVEKPMVLAPPKPPNPKSGKPLYHPPPPMPWEVVPSTNLSLCRADIPQYDLPGVPIVRPRRT
jgi:hypothetical protein